MFCQLNLISKKGPNTIICKKISNIEQYSSLVSLIRHFTKFIFLEQLTAMSQFNMQNMLFIFVVVLFFFFFFFFFFLSSHHDTIPLPRLYHFRKKYNHVLANINSEPSRVIFSFFLFYFFFLSSSSGSNIFVPQQILQPFEAQC